MGERTEFIPQRKSTEWTRFFVPLSAPSATRSASPMQGEDEREQAPGGVEVDHHLTFEPLYQELGRLVVESPPSHVDGLNLGGRGRADGLVIAVADHLVIANDAPERRQRQYVRHEPLAFGGADLEAELLLQKRK